MSSDASVQIESLEAWLSAKPFWEKYVWKLNLEKEFITEEDMELCYKYLSEYLELTDLMSKNETDISFKNEIELDSDIIDEYIKKKIVEIKNFIDVNAISEKCSVKLGSNLTLIFGSNGSGKSGISRLLSNACFSRGEREILPNVKVAPSSKAKPKATFIVDDGSGNMQDYNYSIGEDIDDLKHFSVFDRKSVLIHLDQSNNINFTPAQIKIFDKVAETINKLEEKLNQEKAIKKKDNPFLTLFLSEDFTSDVSLFCNNISASTVVEDFLRYASFNRTDKKMMQAIEAQIDEYKKLDISERKSKLIEDQQDLLALKLSLQAVIDCFTEDRAIEVNKIIDDILEKRKFIENLSIQSFNNGTLKAVGSSEWKALIVAAKALWEKEKLINGENNLNYCMLCHQPLSEETQSLFQRYWQFLENKAEGELTQLLQQKEIIVNHLKAIESTYPVFLITDAGVKLLDKENPTYLKEIKDQFILLHEILNDWIEKIIKQNSVSLEDAPKIDLQEITNIIGTKKTEESELIDPSAKIEALTLQLNTLKHKKKVAAVKKAGMEYISFLQWLSKASKVSFFGIRGAMTKKRTELFLTRAGDSYKKMFNEELINFGCDFSLTMYTSGEHGNTVKEYRLSFAEDYNPSQILSEGEQNVCSLADFLTEVQLDSKNYGIIFDDPVTSLDHERKDKIAERLVGEAGKRQVLILTHDLPFMSQLVKHANRQNIPFIAHWIRKVDGIPGCIEDNTSPKLATLSSLKVKACEATKNYDSLEPSEQENSLGTAFDYLRSACEALIEEILFAGTIKRYDDHIKVQNLEEVVFDKNLALKIVDLHGRISESILAHNRSDLQRENISKLCDFESFQEELNSLEMELRKSLKESQKERDQRKRERKTAQAGW